MSTMTIRLPDDKHERLRQIAKQRKISVNKLIEELSTAAIAEYDAYTRFMTRAAHGSAENGLKMLEELDEYYRTGGN